MKLKGIKPIEQHVEKIVIAISGVAGLALLGVHFFSPSTFEINKQQVALSDAFKPAEEAAQKASAVMASVEPRLPEAPAAPGGEKLAIGLASGSSFKNPMIALTPGPSFGKANVDRSVAAATYQMPTVAPLASVVAHAFRSTVSPLEKIASPALADLLPKEQPFDKASVSLEGLFNGTSFRDQLVADPDGENGPMQPIPLGWWRDPNNEALTSIEIIGVEVERETLRNADGTTPASPIVVMVPGIPTRSNALKMWSESVKSLGDVPPLVEQIRAMEDEIQRPEYLRTIAGPAWKSPAEMAASAATDAEGKTRRVAELKKRLSESDIKIEELQRKIEQAPKTDKSKDKTTTAPPIDRGASGRIKGGANPAAAKKPEEQLNRAALERQLATKVEDRKRVVRSLEELGEKVDAAAADAQTAAPTVLPLLENPEVKLFAHDLTVEAGAQYRYHMRVVLNNPMYGRGLQESQKALAEQGLIRSAWSEWTAPVEVDPSEFFFVTSAEPRSEVNPTPRASAEMYTFYYGYYRLGSASLEPGDSLTATAKLPELKFADMKKVEEYAKAHAGESAPVPVATNPRGTLPGREKRLGGGRIQDPRIAVDRGGAGDGNVPAAAAAAPGPEWLTIPAKKSQEFRVDAVFLDAVPWAVGQRGLAGEDRPHFLAMLRGSSGQLLVRQPDQERAAEVYKRLEASAKEGERQGAPEVKVEEKPRVKPQKSGPSAPSPITGGGGG